MTEKTNDKTTEPKTKKKPENCLVWWQEINILSVCSHQVGGLPEAKLLPGVNKIPTKIWEYLSSHPIMKLHIEEDSLRLMEADGDLSWDDMDVKKASGLISKMGQLDELEEITQVVKNKTLRKVASKRIEEILKSIKPKEE